MITYFKSTKTGLVEQKNLSSHCWVHVVNPNEEEIKFLIENFDLSKDNLLDALDIYEVPRIEYERTLPYIYLRVPTNMLEEESTSSFTIIAAKNNMITIAKEKLEIFDRIIQASSSINTSDKTQFVIKFLSFVSSFFNGQVRNIVKEVKREKKKLSKLNEKVIRDLVIKEDILNDYSASFSPLISIYQSLLKLWKSKISEKSKEVIEDLLVDLNQTFNSCNSALKSISNTRDYYSATLSNNINRTITILTVFTILLAIPTVISGMYGMNIPLPFQTSLNMFSLLIASVLIIWAILILLFKKTRII